MYRVVISLSFIDTFVNILHVSQNHVSQTTSHLRCNKITLRPSNNQSRIYVTQRVRGRTRDTVLTLFTRNCTCRCVDPSFRIIDISLIRKIEPRIVVDISLYMDPERGCKRCCSLGKENLRGRKAWQSTGMRIYLHEERHSSWKNPCLSKEKRDRDING